MLTRRPELISNGYVKVSALQVRQGFSKLLKKLQATDEPIIIERNRVPVAVMISFKAFKRQFLDYGKRQGRDELFAQFRNNAVNSPLNSLAVLHQLRYGSEK